MRCIICLIILLPQLIFSQDFDGWDIPKTGNLDRIVYVSEVDDGHLAYLVSSLSISIAGVSDKGTKTDIDLMRIFKLDEKAELLDQFILHQSVFEGKRNLEFKSYANNYGDSDDIRTYDQLVAEYPDLAAVDKITSYCQKRPAQAYESVLTTAAFKPRITGFNSKQRALKNAEESTGEKKGLGKLAEKLEKSSFGGEAYRSNQKNYVSTGSVGLDWKDTYNGSPDKKTYWANLSQASCPHSGKLIALNGHKIKKQDNSEYLINEIVVFDPDGQALVRKEQHNEVARKNLLGKGNYAQIEDNNRELVGLTVVNWHGTKAKDNPAIRKEVKHMYITTSGDIQKDEIFSLPFDVRSIDEIVHNGNKTILVGTDTKSNQFILLSTPDGQKVIEVPDPDESNYFGFQKFLKREKGGVLMFHNNGDTRGRDLYIYELDDAGNLAGPFNILTEKGAFDEVSDQFTVFHHGENESYFMYKKVEEGINNFKWAMTSFDLYKLGNGELKLINDFGRDQMVLNSKDLSDQKLSYDGPKGIYFINDYFRPDSKDKLRLYRRISLIN